MPEDLERSHHFPFRRNFRGPQLRIPANRRADLGDCVGLRFGGDQIVLSFENRGILLHIGELHILQFERDAILVEGSDHHGRDLLVNACVVRGDVFIAGISREDHSDVVADFHLGEALVDILNADPADAIVLRIGDRRYQRKDPVADGFIIGKHGPDIYVDREGRAVLGRDAMIGVVVPGGIGVGFQELLFYRGAGCFQQG
jgi:hypothetical protein